VGEHAAHDQPTRLCECGCGQAVSGRYYQSRVWYERRFVSGHNSRVMRNLPPKARTPLEERLWPRVVKTDACWLWTGCLAKSGYGQIGGMGKHQIGTHRAAFELRYGPIPPGLYVCHACDANYPPGDTTYRACVRNDGPLVWHEVGGVLWPRYGHLFLGTAQANNDDMNAKGRRRTVTSRGERSGMAVLTEAEVVEMRLLRASNRRVWTFERLGLRYGISLATAQRVCTRKTWNHVG
jgi:hypothetical protein